MAFKRTVMTLIGTSDTSGVTIGSGNSASSAEVDLLGDDQTLGYAIFYLKFTSTTTSGIIEFEIDPSRIPGQVYDDLTPMDSSFAPKNGTQRIMVGRYDVPRYVTVKISNSGTGVNATNVLVSAEVFTMS